MSSGKKVPQFFAGVCVCIGAVGTGTVIAWTANITNALKNGDLNGVSMSDEHLGLTASIMCLGASCMCFPIGWIADAIGRKPTCLLTVIPFTIGWALITIAKHISMVYIGRFLCGVGGGSFCIMAPLYTCEMAETSIRGILGTFLQLFITIGILFAFVFGKLLPLVVFNIFCLAVPLVFAVLFFFQPETPVYDLKKGKKEAAENSFKRLRGKEYDFSGEVQEIQRQIEEEKNMQNFWVVMKTKPAKMSTMICFALMFFQQFTGINAVMFFAGDIFESANVKDVLDESWATILLVGVVQVVATLAASLTIDKIGRKLLCYISLGLMGFSTVIYGIYFTLTKRVGLDKSTEKSVAIVPLIAMVIYIIAFSLGMGPIPWLASTELFPPEIKAKCSSAAGTFNWFLAFLIGFGFKSTTSVIGADVPFYFFFCICVLGFVFIMIFMPETKGKSFQEIQAELSK